MKRRVFSLIYPVLWVLVTPLMWVLGPVVGRGKSRVPKKGGVLLICNHLSNFDPVAVHYRCPRKVFFMAKSELFQNPVFGALIRWFDAFPVKRGSPDRGALRHAMYLLNEGEVVCVFPEGELSRNGELQTLLPGAMLLAKMARVPVVPCSLRHTNRIMPYGLTFPRPAFRRVTVSFGEPRIFDEGANIDSIVAWATEALGGKPASNQTAKGDADPHQE